MSDVDAVIRDVQGKIDHQKTIMAGYTKMRDQSNPTVRSQADNQIRECRRNIEYLESKLHELHVSRMQQGMSNVSMRDQNGGPRLPTTGAPPQIPPLNQGERSQPPPWQATGSYPVPAPNDNAPKVPYPQPGGPSPKGRPNYSRLDLIKYDTPHLGPRIQLMLSQLEFKLSVERQMKDGIEKIMASYDPNRDKKIRNQAQARRLESMQKLQLLTQAMKRYEHLNVEADSITDPTDDDSINAPAMRKPLSGILTLRIHAVSDVEHASPGKRSKAPETFVVLKVEDLVEAKTKSTKHDRWTDEMHEIEINKGNEIEMTVYDKVGSDPPVPVGMLWIRISDIAEEMRRKKIETEFNNSGWVSADRTMEDSQARPDLQFSPPPGQPGIQQTSSFGGPQGQSPPVFIESWFSLEPAGRIQLSMSFSKTGHKRRGLERVGAVKKPKENAEVLYGHKFVPQQFYNIMRCALCGELLKYTVGMQCTECKYLCHKDCYRSVVTKCIGSSNADTDPDEIKINHRVPHRFETFANVSANWCCHCGYILPLGKKTAKRCRECKLCAHAQCMHLVPDFCGLSMKDANQILDHINRIKVEPKPAKRPGLSDRTFRQTSLEKVPRPAPPSNQPSWSGSEQQLQQQQPNPKDRWSYDTETQNMGPSHSHLAARSATQAPPVQPQTLIRPELNRVDSRDAAKAALTAIQGKNSSPTQAYDRPPQYPVQNPQAPQPVAYDPGKYAGYPVGPPQPGPSQKQPLPPPPRDPSLQHQTIPEVRVDVFEENRSGPAPDRVRGSGKRIGLDHFNFLAVLGKGNFGKVMLAETKNTKQLFAIKVLKKEFIIENDEVESTKSERDVFIIANRARHPFLLNLHACFQTETRVYFVMEYISGGDLMLHIQRGQFGTKRAQFYAAEVCLALKYFHENGVVYRDLKLDNILLTLDGHIKIADYGLCKKDMFYGSTTSTFCGTPEFMAPEILLDKKYGRAVDWWAFGVLIYQMLLQQSPFRGDDEDEIYDAILADEPLYPIHMPRDSVSILQKLLTREPENRLGSGPTDAQEIMSHPFFRNINWEDVYHRRMPAPFQPQIKNATDTSNFDSEFTSVTPVLTPVQSVLSPAMQEEFRGFSYSADFA